MARRNYHSDIMREAAACSRMKPRPLVATIVLSDAQVRWLNDPRPYSHPRNDKTFRALIRKGAVIVNEAEHDVHGTGKAGYIVTPAGCEALARRTRTP